MANNNISFKNGNLVGNNDLIIATPDGGFSDNKKGISFYLPGNCYVGVKQIQLLIGFVCTVQTVYLNVDTAPTGANLIIDVNKNGTTMFTTQAARPTITAGNTSVASATPDVTSLVAGDVIGIDIDQIGSTLPGTNLKIFIKFI